MTYTKLLLVNNCFNFSLKQKARGIILSFAFCFIYLLNSAQINFVRNPSFEKVDLCGGSFYISNALNWDSLKAGGGGGNSMIDCSNTNILNQLPRSGRGYAGLSYFKNSPASVSWRSYIQSQLIKKLDKNKKYCVTHYANLLNRSQYAIDELGLYFDSGAVATILPAREAVVNPQVKSPVGIFYSDTLNWMKVQGTFIATGTENYLTLGNFKSYASATYSLVYPSSIGMVAEYYIDDVSVIEADLPAYAGKDTVICSGDSVFIGRQPEVGLECIWFNNSSQISTGGGIWVKPITTQNFIVHQDVCGIITKDTIQVQIKPKLNTQPTLVSNVLAICPPDTLKLNVLNAPLGTNVKYHWQSNNSVYTNTTNTTASSMLQKSSLFTNIITSNGEDTFCPFSFTNTILINVADSCFREPEIPNIFSPNNDGVNDVWMIKFPYSFELKEMAIYNRWGALMYERKDISFNKQTTSNIGWDGHTTSGELCTDGVYFYTLKYINRTSEVKSLKGNLTLIR
jgi:gliding motility-associated-like protein